MLPSFERAPAPTQLRRRRVLVDLARIFSTVCNPFVTAMALFVILAHAFAHDVGTFWFLLFSSTIFTSIGPMLFVFWLYSSGRISDLDMSIRSERESVFSVFVISYFLGTIALALVRAPTMLVATMAGYTASALVVQFITRHWKISTHALGITAPLTALIYLYGWGPAPFLLLIPIVGWSRVYLHAHTLMQVVAGTALGFASVVLFFRLFRLF